MQNLKGKTSTNFNYEISMKRLNNYELVEFLGRLEDEPLMLPKIVDLLLGKAQAERLKNHVRDEEGLVSAELLSAEINEILTSQTQLKN